MIRNDENEIFDSSPLRADVPRSESALTPEEVGDKPPTLRAFENENWMKSKEARTVRIISEFLESQGRLREENVVGSILFFGSARIRSEKQWAKEMDELTHELSQANNEERLKLEYKKWTLNKQLPLIPWWAKTRRLAKLITEWAATEEARRVCQTILGRPSDESWDPPGLVITTGGGPGMMEAANRGAADVKNGRSMGMGITLPFEDKLNRYVPANLSFKYHYFFTRKFWMVYMALGCVAVPGGLGTLDELMELLTLRSTGRFKMEIPIILFGKEFWKKTINFEYLRDVGMISDRDYDMLVWTDDEAEALECIRSTLLRAVAASGDAVKADC